MKQQNTTGNLPTDFIRCVNPKTGKVKMIRRYICEKTSWQKKTGFIPDTAVGYEQPARKPTPSVPPNPKPVTTPQQPATPPPTTPEVPPIVNDVEPGATEPAVEMPEIQINAAGISEHSINPNKARATSSRVR